MPQINAEVLHKCRPPFCRVVSFGGESVFKFCRKTSQHWLPWPQHCHKATSICSSRLLSTVNCNLATCRDVLAQP